MTTPSKIVSVTDDAGVTVSIHRDDENQRVRVEAVYLHPAAYARAPGNEIEDGRKVITGQNTVIEFERRPSR